jgi:ankyrin repeat protein
MGELLNTGQMDVYSQDAKCCTSFQYAASAERKEMVSVMLATGKVTGDLREHEGRTPLPPAADAFDASRDVVDMVTELLHNDPIVANVDSEDSERRTPLFHAAARDYGAIVKLLLTLTLLQQMATKRW